jgi:hypothetical protein
MRARMLDRPLVACSALPFPVSFTMTLSLPPPPGVSGAASPIPAEFNTEHGLYRLA